MAKRNHPREVGFFSCGDLSELGAGNREGWLAGDGVLAALHGRSLALAGPSLAAILTLDSPSPPIQIRPPLESSITALEWIVAGDGGLLALALGTSDGYLLLYSLDAHLIHQQIVHPGWILKLRFRELEGGPSYELPSQELCVVIPGIIARFDGSDLRSLLERWFWVNDSQNMEESEEIWVNNSQNMEESEENHKQYLPYRLWNVSTYGNCADAAITGIMPPPLMELESQQRHYCVVTIGNDAVISAYRISSRSLVEAILSKVVPAAFSTISSFSKLIWRSPPASGKKPEKATQPFAKTSPLTCLKDQPRKGLQLTLSPSGSLAAIADSLGRILLLDTRALVVVRLWKGYRDACCLFVEMLVGKDKGKSTLTSQGSEHVKSDYCLCLAIHAPRKGIIEIWKMRTGSRILTVQCPQGSRLLQPSSRHVSSTMGSSYVPLEVYILNGDSGQLSLLNRSIV